MKKTDQKLAEEATNESIAQPNISEEHSMQTVPVNQSVSINGAFRGMNIKGLESIPASMVAVPYCRIIQPTSKNTTLKDGKEATPGYFMFNDIQTEVEELKFVLLRAKVDIKRVDEDGNFVANDFVGITKPKQVLSILGITTDTNKLFVLSLSVTSFTSWGKLMAQLKEMEVDCSYRFQISAKTEKKENKKGKYYVVSFIVGTELDKNALIEMETKASEYGVVLDREILIEEE
jgi:hypothetical protein